MQGFVDSFSTCQQNACEVAVCLCSNILLVKMEDVVLSHTRLMSVGFSQTSGSLSYFFYLQSCHSLSTSSLVLLLYIL